MKTTEIRVRPVIRHAVTRYTSETGPNGVESGGCESLGEFANEGYAEELAEALRRQAALKEFAIVQETMGERTANVYYAYSEDEVKRRLQELKNVPVLPGESVASYRVFSRIRNMLPPA